MAEKQLRKYLADITNGHISQIESHATAAGVPDTNLFDDVESWIELKHTHGNKAFKVRNTQKTWFRRRARARAVNLWILWRHEIDGQMSHGLIWMGKDIIDRVFRDTSPVAWRAESVCVWGPEIDRKELNMLLRGVHCE